MMYAQSAASVNEFLGHSWDKVVSLSQFHFICYFVLVIFFFCMIKRFLFPDDRKLEKILLCPWDKCC